MAARKVLNVVALLQIPIALSMLATAVLAAFYGDGDARGFAAAGAITLVIGWTAFVATRFEGDLSHREGFAIVTLAWASAAVFGGLPYLLTGVVERPAAALFEAMSGFTTTGASVFTDIEALPHGVLLWRSLTHWLGGMGIIVLAIAILPSSASGGFSCSARRCRVRSPNGSGRASRKRPSCCGWCTSH